MKQIFRPIPLILLGFSAWITFVCSSLLKFDDAGNLAAHSYSVWGDWSAHFTFITALQERGFTWLSGDNPLFPGVPFQYPFLSHLLTYFFRVLTRLDVIHATYYLSLILIAVLPTLIFRLFLRLGLTELSSFLSTLCFLLIGGAQFLDSSLNPREPLTNQFNEGSVFTQFILFEFFPQRAFLFGIVALGCLGIFVLKQKVLSPPKTVFLGIACALLALLHIHTWIAMGTFLLGLCLFPDLLPFSVLRKKIFLFGLGTAAVSAPLLCFLLLRGDPHLHQNAWDLWYPGWAQNLKAGLAKAQAMNFFAFWFYNTAFYLPLAGVGIYLKRKEPKFHALAFSGTTLLICALLLNIQPYFYDDLKLFTYAFFFLAPFVGIAIFELSSLQVRPRFLAYGLTAALTFFQISAGTSDLLSFQGGLQSAPFFSRTEFEIAEHFKLARNSANDLVLINPRHNHWVTCLSGNPVALGYEGWLWSWGINYGTRHQQVHDILLGRPNAESAIKELKVSYIVIQTGEQMGNEPVNLPFFESHFSKILSEGTWQVYSAREIKSPSTSVR